MPGTELPKGLARRNRLAAVLILGSLSFMPLAVADGRVVQDKPAIVSKTPDGYFPVNFSKHVGKLLLGKGPTGMFVGYPADGQDMPAFIDEMKATVGRMFFHDAPQIVWNSGSLSPHTGIDETSDLFTAFDDTREVQLAVYVRPEGFAYGYFAMRHTNGDNRCLEGQFIDALGVGVNAFDQFAVSIASTTKN